MSMTVLPAGDGERVPSFLLRGPVRPVEPVQVETGGFSLLRSSLVLGAGIGGAIGALAFGGYLIIAKGEPSASGVPAVVAHPVVSEAPVAAKPEAPAVQAAATVQTQAPEADTEAAAPETPHQVTTTHFDADPSVWTNVRKFSPFPAGSAPVLDAAPPVQTPAAAPSTSQATGEERASRSAEPRHRARAPAKHERQTHVGRRHHLGEAAQAYSPRARTRAIDQTPSDVGGTKMTAEQLRRDSSANPVVNAFAGMFGPK